MTDCGHHQDQGAKGFVPVLEGIKAKAKNVHVYEGLPYHIEGFEESRLLGGKRDFQRAQEFKDSRGRGVKDHFNLLGTGN